MWFLFLNKKKQEDCCLVLQNNNKIKSSKFINILIMRLYEKGTNYFDANIRLR